MPLPFSYKGTVFSILRVVTITPLLQYKFKILVKIKKGRLKTRHVAGMSNLKNEKRIILNANFFHLHLKIQTIALRRLKILQE